MTFPSLDQFRAQIPATALALATTLAALGGLACLGSAAHEAFQLADIAKEAKAAQVGRPNPALEPISASGGQPYIRAPLAQAGVRATEQLNIDLGAMGISILNSKAASPQNFGHGLQLYSVHLQGRGNADSIEGLVFWLEKNKAALQLQRLSAQPMTPSTDDHQADIALDLVVLVAPGKPS